MSAQRTVALSQSLTVAFSSPPTYCTGFETLGRRGSNMGKTDSTVTVVQGNGITPDGLTGEWPGRRPTRSGTHLSSSVPNLLAAITSPTAAMTAK